MANRANFDPAEALRSYHRAELADERGRNPAPPLRALALEGECRSADLAAPGLNPRRRPRLARAEAAAVALFLIAGSGAGIIAAREPQAAARPACLELGQAEGLLRDLGSALGRAVGEFSTESGRPRGGILYNRFN